MQYKINYLKEFFPSDIVNVVVEALSDKGFFPHKENLVVGKLASPHEQERITVYLEILEARKRNYINRRIFRIPKNITRNAKKNF